MTAEFRRLGKSGSYRLGQLRAQGIGTVERPVPFQPRFIRPYHRWPALVWLLGLLAGSLLIVGGAAAGWWFAPFVVGVLAGLANWIGAWSLRVALPAVAVMAAVGWGAPLGWAELRGQHDGAAARVIAAAIGLPASAAITIAVTALVAVVQVLAGYWLGRALTPRSADDLAAGLHDLGSHGGAQERLVPDRGRAVDELVDRASHRQCLYLLVPDLSAQSPAEAA